MATENSFFEKNYGAEEKDRKIERKPNVEKRIKRKISSCLDDADDKIMDAQEKIAITRADFENYNVNAVLEQLQVIDALNEQKETLRAEYVRMFGEKLAG